jgi:hypothetical protein
LISSSKLMTVWSWRRFAEFDIWGFLNINKKYWNIKSIIHFCNKYAWKYKYGSFHLPNGLLIILEISKFYSTLCWPLLVKLNWKSWIFIYKEQKIIYIRTT